MDQKSSQPQPDNQAVDSPPLTKAPQEAEVQRHQEKEASHSTQSTLPIAEIRDGIVILKDGSYRAVVEAEAINFDLMSRQEQEAVEYSYQNFLNSLTFPIQINIQSRNVDAEKYIKTLENSLRGQNNMLLQVITGKYLDFLTDLVDNTTIMDKKFYLIIPFYSTEFTKEAVTAAGKNFFNKLINFVKNKPATLTINEQSFEQAKTELRYRINAIVGGLGACGIRNHLLNTQELIVLYHDFYNPQSGIAEPFPNFDGMFEPVIRKPPLTAPQPPVSSSATPGFQATESSEQYNSSPPIPPATNATDMPLNQQLNQP